MPVLETIRGAFGSDRLAKRKAIKQELAGLQTSESQAKAIQQQLRQLAAREVQANLDHEAAAEKNRIALDVVEAEVSQLVLDDKPIPAALAKRREKCLDEIVAAQSKLNAIVSSVKKLRSDCELKLKSLSVRVAELNSVRGKLKGFDAADPELITQRFVAGERHVWGTKRLRAAERELQIAQNALSASRKQREARSRINSRGDYVESEPSPTELSQARELSHWQAEVNASQAEVTAANAWRAEITQRIVDE